MQTTTSNESYKSSDTEYIPEILRPSWIREYLKWSIAGASIMLAGLVINIIHFSAVRTRAVL